MTRNLIAIKLNFKKTIDSSIMPCPAFSTKLYITRWAGQYKPNLSF